MKLQMLARVTGVAEVTQWTVDGNLVLLHTPRGALCQYATVLYAQREGL